MRIRDMEESSDRRIPDDARQLVLLILGNDLIGVRGIYYVMYRMEQMRLKLADWPEVQKWFDERKDMMMRDLLKNLASTDAGAADAAAFTLKRMRSIGLDWPELDQIERSLRASGDLDEDVSNAFVSKMAGLFHGENPNPVAADMFIPKLRRRNPRDRQALLFAIKPAIVRWMLRVMRQGDDWAVWYLMGELEKEGIDWPEFDTIRQSLEANRATKDLAEEDDDGDDRNERMRERMRDDIAEVMDAMTNTTAKIGRTRFGLASDAMADLMGNDLGQEMLVDAMREDRHWIIANLVNAFFINDNSALTNLIDLLEESPVSWPELRNLPHSVKHLVEAEFRNMLADAGLADSMDAAHSMASTSLWDADDLMREVRQVYSGDPQTWKPSAEQGTRRIRRDIASLPYIGATDEQISRMLDVNRTTLVRTMLIDIKKGATGEAVMMISDLRKRGKDWPELDAMARSINADAKPGTALREDLGNLAQLGVGKLINVLKQPSYSGRHGSNISDVGRRFHGQDIGSTSEIRDIGVLKKGMTSLRKAFKDNEGAAGFAVYIGGHPVMFGVTDSHNLGGSSRDSKIAYDLGAYGDAIDRFYDGPSYKKPPVTTQRSKEQYGIDRGSAPRQYAGDLIDTGKLSGLLDLITAIGRETNQPVTAKIIMSDSTAMLKRRSRGEVKRELERGAKDLRTRLAIYKNSMRPTAKTIEDFIRLSLEKRGSTVRFANGTYRLSTSGYESMKIEDLFRGKQFSASYRSVDPGNYDSVDITYAFNPRENQLVPIKARWTDRGADGKGHGTVEIVVDPAGYLASEMGRDYMSKVVAMPAILKLVKAKQIKQAGSMLDALEKLGVDWPEIGMIRKSLASDRAEG